MDHFISSGDEGQCNGVPRSRGLGSRPGQVNCSWARYLAPTVPLSTQEFRWVPANCQGSLMKCRGNLAMDRGGGGSGNTLSHFMLGKPI